ncbi:hypothetical protein [Fischerella sp. PCC 9605]|uniref:hypothetical protein n=1 Tax=Fischerella sp. PCC 9605 TaxID=1173024 RepID=UPI00047C7FD9|nr:hypothetical protein [Fischerella sp. PCC 9605]
MVSTFEKIQQQSKPVFEQLPDVLIQDPIRKRAYLLPAEQMDAYKVGSETWSQLDTTVVTFSIPGAEQMVEVPSYNSVPNQEPSVLIQYPDGKASYFLTYEQLQQFIIEQPTEKEGYGISFVIPMGMEMIEELPAMMKSMLQSSERVPSTFYERLQ